ncbi:hypothetical protein ACO22_05932 [Paracoccidioides brasiliensis]|uniref:Uncharacterized protein n=1 Tax=Paracoccidioides brasiliensis TaxID=121759 RepID=A0A1D2J901_PARBR|nr:hypothetical protein ACO22_05932 [Paracoccidioides brasiliensis]ODH52963.1 hypothetical protein GX48_00831 [Paracoccidioides brasiliensis]
MLPTQSLGWNGLQALKSRLTGRLLSLPRGAPVGSRPSKWENDAAFLEADLRYIFKTTPVGVDFSEQDYHDMDRIAQDLLASLNDMVNSTLIESVGKTSKSSDTGLHDITILGDKYPKLSGLICFLNASSDKCNLTTGSGPLLFMLPQGRAGTIALGRVAEWKAYLERLMASTQKSLGPQPICLSQEEFMTGVAAAQNQSDMYQKRASIVINAIFNEFRQRSCGETHEIKLKVSEEWQTGSDGPALDMFISRCMERGVWQQAKCGSFKIMVDEAEKGSICAAIQRANEGRKLYLFVDQRGSFDISDKIPPILLSSESFTAESLEELLNQKVFTRITARDYLEGVAVEKFGSREKATLALSLARCLMDFFDEDLELASHSWRPETLYFLRPSGANASDRVLYISLKPKFSGPKPPDLLKTVGPGNPILLSFAKLLLEIENGEKLSMEIHSDSKTNVSKWGEMCAFVNVAEREGNGNYLQAVEGCLYLHMALPKFQEQTSGSTASEVLRKAIYENIVRNLELMVNPQISKRKRRDSVSDLPLSKTLLISSPTTDKGPQEGLLHRPIKSLPRRIACPKSRSDFEIAIVCALPLEFDAVSLIFDEFWDEEFGSAEGDPNIYTTGRIGKSNVVLVLLSNMGKVSAAGTSASLRYSFPSLRVALVTGICGGVPRPGEDDELLLGDVVISRHIVQYDLGRKYDDGFAVRDTVDDSFGRAPKKLRNLLAIFETDMVRQRLEDSTTGHLQEIQIKSATRNPRRGARYRYPGALQDKLFHANYKHKHHLLSSPCLCSKLHRNNNNNNNGPSTHACKDSRHQTCDELGCDHKHLVRRERLEYKRQLEEEECIKEAQAPSIFIGSIGSGDTVMKSSEDRDRIANRHGLLAFEMESAGVWDELPCCIVVKAVCDYADSHKNKIWQDFAAATAASATKALLELYIGSNGLR